MAHSVPTGKEIIVMRRNVVPVPINFATKLRNAGKDVNFLRAWNRPHSGDYALDELFQWIGEITK